MVRFCGVSALAWFAIGMTIAGFEYPRRHAASLASAPRPRLSRVASAADRERRSLAIIERKLRSRRLRLAIVNT